MRVLLIQMPFFTLDTPSISLALLRAGLEREGFACDLSYFNLDFGKRLGRDLYSWIASAPPALLLPDLTFAPILHDRAVSIPRLSALAARAREPGHVGVPGYLIDRLPELAATARSFLMDHLRQTEWSKYDLLGLGTMFHAVPSLALARLVKTLEHAPPIILGGTSCEGEMGEQLHRSYPFIDYVCRGEGDRLIVDLVRSLERGATGLESIDGLVWRNGTETRCNGDLTRPPPHARSPAPRRRSAKRDPPRIDPEYPLDSLPVPKYDDWLEQIRALGILREDEFRLPIQTARGCWYGAKHHCTFCGINPASIAFRRKSPERVLHEVRELAGHGVRTLHSVDNILDVRYFKTLLPELARLDHGCEIFCEIKANLTYEQVVLLRNSGFIWIQPGIESLSTPILKLMQKGVSAYQNVRLLKYAAELGVGVGWNLLYGFPGEDPRDFHEMAELLPALSHLQPPYLIGSRLRILRFSPLFVHQQDYGLKDVTPTPAHYEVYPFDRETVSRLAYYFQHRPVAQPDPNAYIGPCVRAVQSWHREVGRSALICFDSFEGLAIIDTRAIASRREAVLRGLERDVFRGCRHGATLRELVHRLEKPEHEVMPILESLIESRWLVHLDRRYLSLAVPVDGFAPKHIPLAMVKDRLGDFFCRQMSRLHQGCAPPLPPPPRRQSASGGDVGVS